MARTIPVDNPAACPDAVAWDAMTMDTYALLHVDLATLFVTGGYCRVTAGEKASPK
jgi:hypothetical protein